MSTDKYIYTDHDKSVRSFLESRRFKPTDAIPVDRAAEQACILKARASLLLHSAICNKTISLFIRGGEEGYGGSWKCCEHGLKNELGFHSIAFGRDLSAGVENQGSFRPRLVRLHYYPTLRTDINLRITFERIERYRVCRRIARSDIDELVPTYAPYNRNDKKRC